MQGLRNSSVLTFSYVWDYCSYFVKNTWSSRVRYYFDDKRTMQVYSLTAVLVLEHFNIRTVSWLYTLILTKVNTSHRFKRQPSVVLLLATLRNLLEFCSLLWFIFIFNIDYRTMLTNTSYFDVGCLLFISDYFDNISIGSSSIVVWSKQTIQCAYFQFKRYD